MSLIRHYFNSPFVLAALTLVMLVILVIKTNSIHWYSAYLVVFASAYVWVGFSLWKRRKG